MIPVYEFLTWFSHSRTMRWCCLSVSFYMLTLPLAEAKGNMDLAASPGGSGNSFIPRKLFWIHGQAGMFKFFSCLFQISYHWKRQWFDEDTMNHWTSKQSINWSSTTNQYNRGLVIWCYVPAPICKSTLLLNTRAFIMKAKPFERFLFNLYHCCCRTDFSLCLKGLNLHSLYLFG